MVLTPKGRVARYFYGVEYSPRDLRFGLIKAAEDRIGSPVDQFLLYCFHYDPSTGTYSAAVLNIIRLGGALTVLGLLGFIVTSGRGSKRRRSNDDGVKATTSSTR
jgi:protein SCO1/2